MIVTQIIDKHPYSNQYKYSIINMSKNQLEMCDIINYLHFLVGKQIPFNHLQKKIDGERKEVPSRRHLEIIENADKTLSVKCSWENEIWYRYENWDDELKSKENKIYYITIEEHDGEFYIPFGNHVFKWTDINKGGKIQQVDKYSCGPKGYKKPASSCLTFPILRSDNE